MKNKKIVIALFALAVVLLGGFTVGVLQGITPEKNTFNVVIKYYTVDSYGEQTLYKTYSEEYAEGEQINIKSPTIEGYQPNKEKVSAIVKSDLNITVLYHCAHLVLTDCGYTNSDNQHHRHEKVCDTCYSSILGELEEHVPDESLDKVISYPTSTAVGVLERTCSLCSTTYTEEFTTLTRTVTFGGEILRGLTVGDSSDGYTLENSGQVLVRRSNALPELDIIFNGITHFNGNIGLGEAASVTFSYDKEAWNNDKIVYRALMSDPVDADADFSFRFGNAYRIILGYEGRTDGYLSEFIADENCPLFSAPLTITLTYDYTK